MLVLLVCAVCLYGLYRRPEIVAGILNIPEPPSSMRVLECESPPTTDVVTTCAIEINPEQFPKLLEGYQFQEQLANGTSHSVVGLDVGPVFSVSRKYMARPPEFAHGGFVSIFTNSERRQAIVDLYIE